MKSNVLKLRNVLIVLAAICAAIATALLVQTPVFATTKGSELTPLFELTFDGETALYDSVSKADLPVTATGTQTVVDRVGGGKAMQFDGTGGLALTNTPDLSSAFTLEFDFYQQSPPSECILVGKSNYDGNTQREWSIVLKTEGTKMPLILNLWTGSAWRTISGYAPIAQWNHVKLEMTPSQAWLYINGECWGGQTVTHTATEAALLIGKGMRGTNGMQYFPGQLDEIKLYSGRDVVDSMKEKVPAQDLAVRYNMEDAITTTVPNAAGESYVASATPAIGNQNATASKITNGVEGKGFYLNGKNILTTGYTVDMSKDYTLSVSFNVSGLSGDQVVVGQANYGQGKRDFTLYINSVGNIILNVRNQSEGWITTTLGEITVGKWHSATVSQKGNEVTVYLDGFAARKTDVSARNANSGVQMTVGGVISNTTVNQPMTGYVDEVCVWTRALSEEEIWNGLSDQITKVKRAPVTIAEEDLMAGIRNIEGTQFLSVRKSDMTAGGYGWQHGIALAFFDGKFYASWGQNVGQENTPGEECVVYTSEDAISWTLDHTFVTSVEGYGYSHPSFATVNEKLYLFTPHFAGSSNKATSGIRFTDIKMQGFCLGDDGEWTSLGIEIPDFWPLQEAQKMANGNWIMGGIDGGWRAAVAISDGDDMTKWKVVKIPYLATNFTETTVIVEGSNVTAYMRNQKGFDPDVTTIGISKSADCGETWTVAQESNLFGNTSKPYTGILSTGEKYFINNSVKGGNTSRNTLTIALTQPNGDTYDRVYVIRDMEIPQSLKRVYSEIELNTALSYPYAIEKDGKLYVGYSAYGYGGTNFNHIELAIIDLPFFANESEAKAFEEEHHSSLSGDAQAVKGVYAEYELLSTGVKEELARTGFAAALQNAHQAVLMEEEKVEAEQTAQAVLAMIDGCTQETLSAAQAQVQEAYAQLTNAQRAMLSVQTVKKIEGFLAFAEE